VHTGQHYDANMSDLFFRQLGIPEPDLNSASGSGSHAVQTAEIMKGSSPWLLEHRPDAVLVVGDVNSTIACGLVAVGDGHQGWCTSRRGCAASTAGHAEEINRILTDAISDLLFCTEVSGPLNLKRDGIADEKIHLVGKVMIDTLMKHRARAEASGFLRELGLEPAGTPSSRCTGPPSNVDDPGGAGRHPRSAEAVSREMPRSSSPPTAHPGEADGPSAWKVRLARLCGLRMIEPAGYLDFLS